MIYRSSSLWRRFSRPSNDKIVKGMRGFCSDERPGGVHKKRNRNVRQDEQEATLGNILDHFSLIGPFPTLTTNQAVRIKGLAELYVVFLSPIYSSNYRTTHTRSYVQTHTRSSNPGRNERKRHNPITFSSNRIFYSLGFVMLCVMILF